MHLVHVHHSWLYFTSQSLLMMCYRCVSDLSWKIAALVEIKSRGYFTLSNHLIWVRQFPCVCVMAALLNFCVSCECVCPHLQYCFWVMMSLWLSTDLFTVSFGWETLTSQEKKAPSQNSRWISSIVRFEPQLSRVFHAGCVAQAW